MVALIYIVFRIRIMKKKILCLSQESFNARFAVTRIKIVWIFTECSSATYYQRRKTISIFLSISKSRNSVDLIELFKKCT